MSTQTKRLQPGQRCRLRATVRHAEFANKPGTVRKYVKVRDVYVVDVDGMARYDADPANVEPLCSP